MKTICPTSATLTDFVLDKLPSSDHAFVDQHLDICRSCQDTLNGLEVFDSVVAGLMGVWSAESANQTPGRRGRLRADFATEIGPEPTTTVDEGTETLIDDSDQFVTELLSSGVITEAEWSNLRAQLPVDPLAVNAESLASTLVGHGVLTEFQASTILSGAARWLVLGEYLLLAPIGAGGMGQVFLALERRMGRRVALKTLPVETTPSADTVARFQREACAAARLKHPNIVTTIDAGEVQGVHYLVMEHVDGDDLSAVLKQRGPLSVDEAVDYVVQAARGLEYAHRQGVVHRDIKPSNLLLDQNGVVKILDMGLARLDSAADLVDHQLTITGQLLGTVDYMAPEQATQSDEADHRSDIYSLGCTLFRLLTGDNIYPGKMPLQKLLAHLSAPLPSLLQQRSDVPDELDRVFRRMVTKNPADRYQHATELVADLETWRSGNVAPGATINASASLSGCSPPRGQRNFAWVAAGLGGLAFLAVWGLSGSARDKYDFDLAVPPIANHQPLRRRADTVAVVPQVATTASTSATQTPPQAIAPFDADQARAHQEAWAAHLGVPVEVTNSLDMPMALIPPGEFLMGSAAEQIAAAHAMGEAESPMPQILRYFERLSAEGPQHRVVISRPYWMGASEVTIGQFRAFVDATGYVPQAEQFAERGNGDSDTQLTPDSTMRRSWREPGYPVTDDSPVTLITWNDATAFCAWLSETDESALSHRPGDRHTRRYRLPTEAEWEFACRAGTTTQFSFGDNVEFMVCHDWNRDNSWGQAQPVTQKTPNAFGLFDMHGNVREWCFDWCDERWYAISPPNDPVGAPAGKQRAIRGGGWNLAASHGRSAFRHRFGPRSRFSNVGFRCVYGD